LNSYSAVPRRVAGLFREPGGISGSHSNRTDSTTHRVRRHIRRYVGKPTLFSLTVEAHGVSA